MAESKETPKYVTADEFFDSPEPSTSFAEARRAFLQEADASLLDPTVLRSQEDWGFLANRIVGAEDI